MCSAFPKRAALLVAICVGAAAAGCASHRQPAAPQAAPEPTRVLRVVADPNNLPFSNDKLEGFENRLAELVARELGAKLEYSWRAQRRGFFRHAFQDDGGDLVMGVPAGFERALTTSPYYRSSYAFVYRSDRGLDLKSLDDPRLRNMKIGVQIVGDESSGSPPAFALARRGLVNNIVGYTLYGDYTRANPPARIMDAVANGSVDIAIVWGPLAGYFAKRENVPMEVVPLPPLDRSGLALAYDISVGVKKGDKSLRDEVNAILTRDRSRVEKILDDYGVPRVSGGDGAAPIAAGVAAGSEP